MNIAVLSLDIEDWYHLDYLSGSHASRTHSMLDGLDVYQEILDSYGIRSSFFVLGELVPEIKHKLRELAGDGHDIGSHGQCHTRPLTMPVEEFEKEIEACKNNLEMALGQSVHGFRAPCFSLDRDRLDTVQKVGYDFDASLIKFGGHSLYGEIDLTGYDKISDGLYINDAFFEFETSTLQIGSRYVPVSGGGYLRIFPWSLMERLLDRFLLQNNFFSLYIHPFELSRKSVPPFPSKTNLRNKFRFSIGRNSTEKKLRLLIEKLISHEFNFETYLSAKHLAMSRSLR